MQTLRVLCDKNRYLPLWKNHQSDIHKFLLDLISWSKNVKRFYRLKPLLQPSLCCFFANFGSASKSLIRPSPLGYFLIILCGSVFIVPYYEKQSLKTDRKRSILFILELQNWTKMENHTKFSWVFEPHKIQGCLSWEFNYWYTLSGENPPIAW